MKKLFAILLILILPCVVFAEDIYIADAAAGGDTGANCANAHSASWFNTAGNWGGGAGEIDAGDTAHLCGTIATNLTVQGSGTAGNVITVIFEDGASLSKDTWGNPGRAIVVSGKSFVVIDGGTNGIIEATQQGTALTYQNVQQGVYLTGTTNVEVKNLTIRNIFVRTPGTNGAFQGNGVRAEGVSTNLSIHNNSMSYGNSGVYVAYGNGSDNVNIYSNTITHGANGIVVGNSGASAISNLNVYSNTINLFEDSSDNTCGNTFHNDGIQIFAVTAGSSVSSARVYGNKIGPDMGGCTATTGWIFFEGYSNNPKIYNNVLLADASNNKPTNGFIYFKPISGYTNNPEIYNNTIVSDDTGGTGISDYKVLSNGLIAYNNILKNLNVGIYISGTNYTDIDYNAYDNNSTNRWAGTDANGITGTIALDANYIPTAGSIVIDNGVSVASEFTSDYAGTSRPQGAAWDMGAYEYDQATPDSIPSAFSFSDVTGAALSTETTTSPGITVAGIDAGQTPAITISGTGCTYNIDGGAFTADAGTVGLDNVVLMKVTSSAAYSTAVSCTLTIGGVSDAWSVTTQAAVEDVDPPTPPRFRGSGRGRWR